MITTSNNFEKFELKGIEVQSPDTFNGKKIKDFLLQSVTIKKASEYIFDDCDFEGVSSLIGDEGKYLEIQGKLCFRNCRFHGPFKLNKVVTEYGGEIEFLKCTFKEPVQFISFCFRGNLSFTDKTQFFKPVIFVTLPSSSHPSALEGNVNFRECKFEDDVKMFGIAATGTMDFTRATFKKGLDLSASSSPAPQMPQMGEFNFERTTFMGKLDLSNRTLTRRTSFLRTRFNFNKPPYFHKTTLFPDTTFAEAEFSENLSCEVQTADQKMTAEDKRANAVNAENAYRSLRVACKAIEAHNDEQYFFTLEMRARQAAQQTWYMRGLYGAYGLFSNYGKSIFRPLAYFFVGVIISSLILLFINVHPLTVQSNLQKAQAGSQKKSVEIVMEDVTGESIKFTLANAVPFIPAFKEAKIFAPDRLTLIGNILLYIWIFSNALFSYAMWFLIGLGLRNQFRLKS